MKFWILILIAALSFSCSDKNDKLVKIKTSEGEITVLLYEETPKHKQNFLELAESGEYDSTIFHRVIKNFMIQGGDIYRESKKKETKNKLLDAEFVEGLLHTKGALAAARQGDNVNPARKSSSCQFYIVQGKVWDEEELRVDQSKLNLALGELLKDEAYDSLLQIFDSLNLKRDFKEMDRIARMNKDMVAEVTGQDFDTNMSEERIEAYTSIGGTPHLDDQYTIFGKVVEGLEVIDDIASVRTQNNNPRDQIYMTMEIVELPKEEITKKYGYEYPEK